MKIIDFVYDSEAKKLNCFVNKLLEITDLLSSSLSINQYIERKILSKRKNSLDLADLKKEIFEQDPTNSEPGKRVNTTHNAPNMLDNNDNATMNENLVQTKKVDVVDQNEKKQLAFGIKLMYESLLNKYIQKDQIIRKIYWENDQNNVEMSINRTDFFYLPQLVTLKLSRVHAKVIAQKNSCNPNEIKFEVSDSSTNGVYYLDGSKLKTPSCNGDTMIFGEFKKINKGESLKIKHGDVVGLIMKNGSNQATEMSLGFQFLEYI